MINNVAGRNSLFRKIQLEIRDYIIAHNLQPGDMLPPAAEIATRMGVSSATLREAFRALEALGVLTTKHGVGTFIRAYDLSPILDNISFSLLFASENLYKLAEIREAMEIGLIPAMVAQISDADIKELENLVGQMRDNDLDGNDLEVAFHTALYRCLDNDMIPQFLNIFWVVHRDLLNRAMIVNADNDNRWVTHVPIVQAIKARDVVAAVGAMRSHFEGIKSQLQHEHPRP